MDKIRDLREKFFQVDDEYLNGYAKLCGINATGVYLSMCRHANKQQQCFPSKKLIAEELAISERSVYAAIKKLEEWNIIKIEEQGRRENGSFKNLLYTLLNKKEWKTKPSANCAVGKLCRRQTVPSANNDTSRRHVVPNKDTHIEGNTYIFSPEGEKADKPSNQKIQPKGVKPLVGTTPTLPRASLKFKQEDYSAVLDKYQEIRGVTLNGPEFIPIRQAVKTMFMANRSVEDIIGCMKWLSEKSKPWMEDWTIQTVKNKLPDFLAIKEIKHFWR